MIDCLFAREKIFRQIRCPYLYPWLYFCVRYQELFWLQISFSLSTSWLFGHWCCFSSFSSSIFMSHHIFCIFVVRKSLMKWTIHVVRSLKEWFWFLSFHLLFSLFFCYLKWSSFRDLWRRCVVNILTLNTVNQQSYHECQLYYFYWRKIKTFPYQDQKIYANTYYAVFTFTVSIRPNIEW